MRAVNDALPGAAHTPNVERSPDMIDARDKSRPEASSRLQFIDKRGVFRGLAGQECRGYLFVVGIMNARSTS